MRDISVEALFPEGGERFELGSSGWSRILGIDAVGRPPHRDFADEGSARAASDLAAALTDLHHNETLVATVKLTNTGTRPALETVQAYVSDLVTSVTWAALELKGFTQVTIDPGQTITATVEIPIPDCSIVTSAGRRAVEPGDFELRIGPSSVPSQHLTLAFHVRPSSTAEDSSGAARAGQNG